MAHNPRRAARLNGLFPLSYLGVNPTSPVDFVIETRPPTQNDIKNFYIGALWLDMSNRPPDNEDIYMLVDKNGNVATWVNFGGGDVETLSGDSGTNPVTPDTNDNINVFGDNAVGLTVSGDGVNTLTVTTINSVPLLQFLEGNSGGPVGPDATSVINTLGDGVGITVVGNPGTNTLTWSLVGGGIAAQSFPTGPGASTTSGGTATPTAAGVLNILGDHNVDTGAAVANTVTVFGTNAITLGDLSDVSLSPAITVETGDLQFTDPNLSQNPTTLQRILFTSNSAGNPNLISFFLNSVHIGQGAGNLTMTPGVALFNVGVGGFTLTALTTGTQNVAIGHSSMQNATSAQDNLMLGFGSGQAITTGSGNCGIGSDVLSSGALGITTGSRNCAIGNAAGASYTGAESDNVMIANSGVVGENNTLRIGAATGAGNFQLNRCFIAGIRGITTGVADAINVLIDSAGQLGTVSSSLKYKQNIRDMAEQSEVIYDLRPVTFNYKEHPGVPAWGLIAEEVDKVFPQLVVYKDGEPETIKYQDLPALLLNEIQKLKKRIDELERSQYN